MADTKIVSKLVFGIGGLLVLTIITMIIVGTIVNADLFGRELIANNNEENATIDATGWTLTNFTSGQVNLVIVAAANFSDGTAIDAANYTLNQQTGLVTAVGPQEWLNVTFNYTYEEIGKWETNTRSMTGNFTGGIDNVSTKIPTILLIAGVVLLFGVLIFLIARSKQMGVGGSSGGL